MPAGVEDRNADVWEALLGVADLAGGDWPNLSRRAATELVKAAREIEPSLNIRLLEDLRTIFEGEDSLSTKDVLARLCLLEDAPWNDLKGKPITDRQLSQRLGAYGVKSKTRPNRDRHRREAMRAPISTTSGGATSLPCRRTRNIRNSRNISIFSDGLGRGITKSEGATSRFQPQQDSGPDVAVVANDAGGLLRIKQAPESRWNKRCCGCCGCCAFYGERGRAKPQPAGCLRREGLRGMARSNR